MQVFQVSLCRLKDSQSALEDILYEQVENSTLDQNPDRTSSPSHDHDDDDLMGDPILISLDQQNDQKKKGYAISDGIVDHLSVQKKTI
jgi:hypothetical protein